MLPTTFSDTYRRSDSKHKEAPALTSAGTSGYSYHTPTNSTTQTGLHPSAALAPLPATHLCVLPAPICQPLKPHGLSDRLQLR